MSDGRCVSVWQGQSARLIAALNRIRDAGVTLNKSVSLRKGNYSFSGMSLTSMVFKEKRSLLKVLAHPVTSRN